MHTDIKLDCDQCSYKHNTKNSLKEHKELFMKISDMPAISVITELQEQAILTCTNGLFTGESNIVAIIVNKTMWQKGISDPSEH